MLEELTKEQLRLADEVADEYIGILSNLSPTVNMDDAKAFLSMVYGEIYKMPLPEIVVAKSHVNGIEIARKRGATGELQYDRVGISDAGWVAYSDFWRRIGVQTEEEAAESMLLSRFMRSAWDTMLFKECAIVLQHPLFVKTDRQGDLHCETGPAISWEGEDRFFWHGVVVADKRMVMEPDSYDAKQYAAITNTEQRRILSEKLGWGKVMKMLGAVKINAWRDGATGLTYSLWEAPGQKFLKKKSPLLQTGEQPTYVEPVHEDLKTAQAARKWQATALSVADCEKDPALSYGSET